jgi:hypothetical protein
MDEPPQQMETDSGQKHAGLTFTQHQKRQLMQQAALLSQRKDAGTSGGQCLGNVHARVPALPSNYQLPSNLTLLRSSMPCGFTTISKGCDMDVGILYQPSTTCRGAQRVAAGDMLSTHSRLPVPTVLGKATQPAPLAVPQLPQLQL